MILLQVSGGLRASIFSLILHSSPFAKTILVLLVVVSVYSWAVIWNRLQLYARVERADRTFLGAFRRLRPGADLRTLCESMPASFLAKVALAGETSFERHARDATLTPERRWELALRAMDRRA